MADDKQYRLPLPVPAPAPKGVLDSSMIAAQTEFEETKIKILGDIHHSISNILPQISSIAKIMKDDLALTKDKIKQEKSKAGEELEAGRETKEPKVSSSLKEAMNEGKGFWTVVTAFFIPAILGFVDAIFDLTSPLGLLGAAVTGLFTFFASRSILMLIAGSIKLMIAKISAAIVASIAASKIGTAVRDRLGGLFSDKQTSSPSSPGKPAPSGKTTPSPTGKTAPAGRAGGAAKFLSGANLLKGAVGMLAAAGAIFVLGEALEKFSDLKWETLAVAGTAVVGLATAAAVIGKFSPLILSGSFALGALGVALIPLAGALALVSPLVWAFGEALEGLSSLVSSIGNLITSFSDSFVKVLDKVSQLDAGQIVAAAGAIGLLSLSLVALGAGTLVNGLLNLFSGDPIGKLIKLGNVAPNIVELAEVMAKFGSIVEFFNDALDNLNGDEAIKQFKLMRDGILMVGKALDDVSMIKLVAFSALTKMSANKPVISETLESTSRNISQSADVAYGNAPSRRSTSSESFSGSFSEMKLAQNDPALYSEFKKRERELYQEHLRKAGPDFDEFDEDSAMRYAKIEAIKEFSPELQQVGALSNVQTSTKPQALPSNNTRTVEMGLARSDVRDSSSRVAAQSSMVSVNNVNSVNKNETNYKSTSLGTALQGDALRYVY